MTATMAAKASPHNAVWEKTKARVAGETAMKVAGTLMWGGLAVVDVILIAEYIAIGGFLGWLLAAVFTGCAMFMVSMLIATWSV